MAKEKWKCPYPDCKQECSRHPNMIRHIERKLGRLGKPVKAKSTAVIQPIPEVFGRTNPSAPPRKKPSDMSRTEENDLVDTNYEDVKKANAKMNKIREIKAFFSEPS